jgi:hypothetical protein
MHIVQRTHNKGRYNKWTKKGNTGAKTMEIFRHFFLGFEIDCITVDHWFNAEWWTSIKHT